MPWSSSIIGIMHVSKKVFTSTWHKQVVSETSQSSANYPIISTSCTRHSVMTIHTVKILIYLLHELYTQSTNYVTQFHFNRYWLKTAGNDVPVCWQTQAIRHLGAHLLPASASIPHEPHLLSPCHCCPPQKSALNAHTSAAHTTKQ